MPCLKNNRIGIFGGAFDPPHRGHEKALQAFILAVQPKMVYVIPSGTPPHKKLSRGAEDRERYEMSRLAFEALSEKVTVSDIEILSPEISYTLLTVGKLKEKHPESELFLFVGTDQFLSFETWREPETLLSLCTLCVMDRFSQREVLLAKKKELEEKFSAQCLLLEEKPYIMSSTDIRSELKEKGYSFRLSPSVNEYISKGSLYKVREDNVRSRLLSRLQKEVDPSRLAHILSVEREVGELAFFLGAANERELRLAALYHDLTKEKTKEEQILLAEEYGYTFAEEDLESPAVLHGITAFLVAKEEGHLSPKALLAIYNHTTGDREMSLEEKILYFADYIEEERSYDACRKMRRFFYENMPEDVTERRNHLDSCIRQVMEDTVAHLKENNRPIHPRTLAALDGLKKGDPMTSQEKAKRIASILDEKKGKAVTILKVENETVITDYFVIATATSSTHLKALCDEVSFKLREEDGITVFRTEGYSGGGWILMDYSDVIVHIFDSEARQFFNLEKLWNGAENIQFECKED